MITHITATHTFFYVPDNTLQHVCAMKLQYTATHCVAVCCGVLRCVAVQCVAVYCSVMKCVAVCCSVLQCVASISNTLNNKEVHAVEKCATAFGGNTTNRNTLQHAATHCNTLQHTATHSNIHTLTPNKLDDKEVRAVKRCAIARFCEHLLSCIL